MHHRDHPTAVASERHKTRRFEGLGSVEVLALAIHTERANARRYRAFADSFHGYDDEVAQGFDKLAEEEHKYEVSLLSAFQERFGESIPPVDEPDVDVVVESVDLDDAEHQIFAFLELRRVFECLNWRCNLSALPTTYTRERLSQRRARS